MKEWRRRRRRRGSKTQTAPNELDRGVALNLVGLAELAVEVAVHLAEQDLGGGFGSLLELGSKILAVTAPWGVELDDGVDVLQGVVEVRGSQHLNLRLALIHKLAELVGDKL